MLIRSSLFGATFLSVLMGAPAVADTPCDVTPPLEGLSGAYEVTIGTALLFDGARVATARATETFPVTMEAQGELLVMEAGPNTITFEYADPEDGALDFKELEDVLDVAPDDIPALLGCGLDRLPVLIGGGSASSQEGTPLEFRYELMIWDYSEGQLPEMAGTLSWSGGGIMSARSVLVSPSE